MNTDVNDQTDVDELLAMANELLEGNTGKTANLQKSLGVEPDKRGIMKILTSGLKKVSEMSDRVQANLLWQIRKLPPPRFVAREKMLEIKNRDDLHRAIREIREERLRKTVAFIPGIKPERWVSLPDPKSPTGIILCLLLKNEDVLKFRCLDAGIVCNTRFKESKHYKTEPIEKIEGWYHFQVFDTN